MLQDVDWRHTIRKRHRLQHDGSSCSDSNSTRINNNWTVTAGVFLIQLTIPTIISSYGVLLSHLIENNYFLLWHGLLPSLTYITTRSLIDPVCRNVFSGQSLNSRKTAMCGVIAIAVSIAFNVLLQSVVLQVFSLGIVGGLCTSIVVTQAEAVLYCHFPAQRNLTQVLCHLGLALGYFGMPLLMNGLINQYGIHGSFLLHSGIVLQGLIGATLLCPPQDNDTDLAYINRPRAYTVVDDVEMIDFSAHSNGHSGHSPLLSPARNWRNPADIRYDVAQTSSPVTSIRQKNINGVDILPEIPEESEENSSECDSSNNVESSAQQEIRNIFKQDSFENYDRSANAKIPDRSEKVSVSKSLHKWRNINLHSDGNEKENKKTNDMANIQNINFVNCSEETRDLSSFARCGESMRFQRLESTSETRLNSPSFFGQIKYVFLCAWCNKVSFYKCYLTVLNFPNDIHFYLVVPMINAIKVPDFFPAVFLYTVLRLCPITFTVFIPFLTRQRIVTSSSQEGAFTISVAAFCWLCFLLFSPCFLQAKTNTKKFIYFVGSMFLSAGFYIVSTTKSHGYIVLGCALFGLGHGATSGTVTSIFEEDMGTRKFVKVQGPLDVVSGFFALILSIILGALLQHENGLLHCFLTLTVLQLSTSIVWILSLLKAMVLQLRNISNREWHPGGDFLTPG